VYEDHYNIALGKVPHLIDSTIVDAKGIYKIGVGGKRPFHHYLC